MESKFIRSIEAIRPSSQLCWFPICSAPSQFTGTQKPPDDLQFTTVWEQHFSAFSGMHTFSSWVIFAISSICCRTRNATHAMKKCMCFSCQGCTTIFDMKNRSVQVFRHTFNTLQPLLDSVFFISSGRRGPVHETWQVLVTPSVMSSIKLTNHHHVCLPTHFYKILTLKRIFFHHSPNSDLCFLPSFEFLIIIQLCLMMNISFKSKHQVMCDKQYSLAQLKESSAESLTSVMSLLIHWLITYMKDMLCESDGVWDSCVTQFVSLLLQDPRIGVELHPC